MEADTTVNQLQVRVRDRRIQHVFVNVIAGARVHHQYLVLDVAVGQSAQPPQSLSADYVDSPADHRGRILVEPLEYFGVGTCSVVVADKRQPATMYNFIDTPFGIAAVPHHVAETEGLVALRTVAEHRVQRLPVGVDVREDHDLQAGFSYRRG